MDLIAVAFYETSWFKAVVYVLIAVIAARVVDFFLARRDATMAKLLGRTPGRADRTRYVMIRRLIQAVILIIGFAMALFQFPLFQTLSGAILASAAIISGVIGIAARAPLANLVSGVMIAFSQPVRLGDYISVDDVYGTVEELGAADVTLRLHAWAHDPLTRRDLASDLRAAILRRLCDDGVLGNAREASGAAD